MRSYESVLVLAPTLEEGGVVALLDRVRASVEQRQGTFTSVERWGKRRLAYDIRHFKEAHYVLVRFQAEPVGGLADLEHLCRIHEDILRHMIVLDTGSAGTGHATPGPDGAEVVAPAAPPVAAPEVASAPEAESAPEDAAPAPAEDGNATVAVE